MSQVLLDVCFSLLWSEGQMSPLIVTKLIIYIVYPTCLSQEYKARSFSLITRRIGKDIELLGTSRENTMRWIYCVKASCSQVQGNQINPDVFLGSKDESILPNSEKCVYQGRNRGWQHQLQSPVWFLLCLLPHRQFLLTHGMYGRVHCYFHISVVIQAFCST